MTSEELKRRREQLGMTQGELAERLGVRLNTLSRWERGDNWPDAEGMLELAMDHLELLHKLEVGPFLKQVEERIAKLKDLRDELAQMGTSTREK